MKLHLRRRFFASGAALILAGQALAGDTNRPTFVPDGANVVTCDEMASNYLQIQEQLHASQLVIEEDLEAARNASQSNAIALGTRLQSLEQITARQRAGEAEAARRTQQLTLLLTGAFGVLGMGMLVLMVYFQWRAFAQLAQMTAQQRAAVAGSDAVHQLAAPGRAAVDASTTQLLGVVAHLEQRIKELESGQQLLPQIVAAAPGDLLAEGEKHLDADLPQRALEFFDQFLAAQPGRADAMVKRAATLEKLGRDEEALTGYNQAIAADNSLVIAHLHKGGLLNRLRRYDEALNCYEQALMGQEKKARA